MRTKTVSVPNISCGHCVGTIEREISTIEGVEQVQATSADRRVTITWDESETDWEAIRSRMGEIHYPPTE